MAAGAPVSTTPTFEVLAFRARAATRTVALLELDGRFSAETPRGLGRPSLLLETRGRRVECAPVPGPDAAAGPGGVPWRAAFAIPLALLDDSTFVLEIGSELLVELPAPDLGADDDTERLARLAREANDLRRHLDAAEDRAQRAADARRRVEADLTAVQTERDAALAETEAARAERDAALEASAAAEAALAAARGDVEEQVAEERDLAARQLAAVRAAADRELADEREAAERRISATQQAAMRDREENERQLAEARGHHERDLAQARAAAERDAAARLAEPHDEPAAGAESTPRDEPAPTPRFIAPPRDPAEDLTTPLDADQLTPLPDETVRLISGRARPRHRMEDEREPETLAPGATQIGARSITGRADARRRTLDPQRLGALIALIIAIAAFVIVVILRIGPL